MGGRGGLEDSGHQGARGSAGMGSRAHPSRVPRCGQTRRRQRLNPGLNLWRQVQSKLNTYTGEGEGIANPFEL